MPILAAPLPHTPHCLPAYGHWIRRSWHAIVSRRPSRVTSLCARICRKNKNSRIRELHSDSPSTRGASFTSVVQIPMIVGILLRTLRSFHHQLVKGSRRGLPSVEHGDPPFLSSDSCEMPVIRQNLTFCLFVLPFTICPHIRIFSAHSKHNGHCEWHPPTIPAHRETHRTGKYERPQPKLGSSIEVPPQGLEPWTL